MYSIKQNFDNNDFRKQRFDNNDFRKQIFDNTILIYTAFC